MQGEMQMYDFDYIRPASIEDAIAALAAEDAMALGGGQTLIPTLKARLAQPSRLVDLTGVLDTGIRRDESGAVHIGGAARHVTVETSPEAASVPGLQGLAAEIGDPQVRNRGTIGGSLANNDPAACYPAAVLALDARIVTNRRVIPADEYFQGLFTTALEEGEIITEVVFPSSAGPAFDGGEHVEKGHYAKFVQPASRFAMVGVYVAKFPSAVRVAVTGASERGVIRWAEAEEALAQDFRPEAIVELAHPADDMIGDLHGSPEYRAHLVGVMTRRAVAACRATGV